ncbi:MAG: hypothetical protein A3C44_03240 [Gammaproteobacteria bacterium RIFCSPHIGHO2_02_FULL_39_13]|nr:MAG: hypothetical protein A3C44_03240 [Gammaproteobacteria bacterium RIFCSPHIGHO2_02_FULL_39_13]OGT49854.1 MAG: hypothetical protein A3E53_02725 [Gammaproteobacteria bacterium RIFCSPHIGHO2_12_FULL_39_24]
MKKSTVSVLSLVCAASLCVSAATFAYETHPQGEVNFKVKNMSHSIIKVDCGTCSAKTFGTSAVDFTVHKDTFSHAKRLGFDDTKSFVVRYDLEKRDIPGYPWGAVISIKKWVGKTKTGCNIYHRCNVGVKAGPGKAMVMKYGKLCKDVTVKATLHSGTTAYANVTYDPK